MLQGRHNRVIKLWFSPALPRPFPPLGRAILLVLLLLLSPAYSRSANPLFLADVRRTQFDGPRRFSFTVLVATRFFLSELSWV